jgi:hypothetical protein
MGETLHTAAGAALSLHIQTIAAKGSMIHVLLDGEESAPPLSADRTTCSLTVPAGRHWIRLEVRDGAGTTELLSSPLYINYPEE